MQKPRSWHDHTADARVSLRACALRASSLPKSLTCATSKSMTVPSDTTTFHQNSSAPVLSPSDCFQHLDLCLAYVICHHRAS